MGRSERRRRDRIRSPQRMRAPQPVPLRRMCLACAHNLMCRLDMPAAPFPSLPRRSHAVRALLGTLDSRVQRMQLLAVCIRVVCVPQAQLYVCSPCRSRVPCLHGWTEWLPCWLCAHYCCAVARAPVSVRSCATARYVLGAQERRRKVPFSGFVKSSQRGPPSRADRVTSTDCKCKVGTQRSQAHPTRSMASGCA